MKANINNNGSGFNLTLSVDFNQVLNENFAPICKAIANKGIFLKEICALFKERPNPIEDIIPLLMNADNSINAEKDLCEKLGINEVTAHYILDLPLTKLSNLTEESLRKEYDRYIECVAMIR